MLGRAHRVPPGAALAGAALLAACAAGPSPDTAAPPVAGLAPAQGVPFTDYVAANERRLQARPDLAGRTDAARVVAANTPFELRPDPARCGAGPPYARGAVLVHGLAGSPYQMRAVGAALATRCVLVRAVLLPGHGTVRADLNRTGVDDWVAAARYAVNGMRPEVDRLYVAGFSAGGALAVLLALDGAPVDGLVLFAPALDVNFHLPPDFHLGAPAAAAADYARYEHGTAHAARAVIALTHRIAEAFEGGGRVAAPVLAVLSMEDRTVNSREVLDVLTDPARVDPAGLAVLAFAADPGHPACARPAVRCLAARLPEEGLIDFSHVSLTIPPDDPHYGRDGDYHYCAHYPEGSAQRATCVSAPRLLQGELGPSARALAAYAAFNPLPDKAPVMRRLGYNPRFAEMMAAVADFLGRDGPLP